MILKFVLFLAGFLALPVRAQIHLDVFMKEREAKIDSLHYGIFFEDINHAADGGVYAELVRNRSFEDCDSVPLYWSLDLSQASADMKLVEDGLLNPVQRKALKVEIASVARNGIVEVANEGYWGINAVKGRKYKLSFWAKADGYKGTIRVSLQDKAGQTVYASSEVAGKVGRNWQKYTAEFYSEKDDAQARLVLSMDRAGTVCFDMVSLFPPTFKGRENGCRPELVQLLADMKPRFVRFPGGCFVEGEVIEGRLEQFKWKESIGPIEERSSHTNVWRYPVTNGLGYHEFLQLAEDLGAAPLYVTNVGIWHGGFAPYDSIDWYVQDALDAIEYANGDITTKYGAMRAANGHPEPFGMYLIEIGNENYQKNAKQQSDHYPERYIQFYKAIKEKYPYMRIVGNVDAFDFNPQWRNNHPVDFVDEHYYRNPRWFVDRYRKYDAYDRRGPKVYVGEYAVTKEYGVNGNLNAALGEAVFMMGMERNSDVVKMNSYAPIFKNENEARWNPDMIHFNSKDVFVTPSYYVQQLFATHVGDYNVKCVETGNTYPVGQDALRYSVGERLHVADDTREYTATRRFRYTGGKDGVKLYFHYKADDDYGVWHLGAERNKRYNLELHRKGEVCTLAYKYNGVLEDGKWYDARIEVREDSVACYLNGDLVHQARLHPEQWIYTSASVTADGTAGYLKLANPTDKDVIVDIGFKDVEINRVELIRMASGKGTDENSMVDKAVVKPVNMGMLPVVEGNLRLAVPAFSLNIVKTGSVGQGDFEVSSNGRYLQTAEGVPFFVNACTAWTLPVDYARDEVKAYLDNRLREGFNTIQMSAVFSEIDKQMYRKAFHDDDISRPVASYWEKVDWCVKEATGRGLVVMLNPIWKRSVNEFIRRQGEDKCRAFGRWIAKRYKDNPHVFYFIGGDQIPEPVRAELDAMGKGIQEEYDGKAIVAYHSCGSQSSKEAYPDASWLTLNWTYAYTPAYRFEGAPRYPYQMNYENIKRYKNIPIQFGEGYYDFGSAKTYSADGTSGRWGNRYVLRRQAWWNVTSGAAGVAYGAEGVWHKNRDGETWTKCLEYESSKDMGRLKRLFDRLEWWKLYPDMDHKFLVSGYGEYLTDDYATAAVADDMSFMLVYTPVPHALHIRFPENDSKQVAGMKWFDPTNGDETEVRDYVLKEGCLVVEPPSVNSSGTGDWVLVWARTKK